MKSTLILAALAASLALTACGKKDEAPAVVVEQPVAAAPTTVTPATGDVTVVPADTEVHATSADEKK